jgi:hypothetical protein
VEPCKCEMVSCSVGKFTREAYIAVYGKEPIDWAKAKREGATIPLERFVEVRQDVEGQQVMMQDPFIKKRSHSKKLIVQSGVLLLGKMMIDLLFAKGRHINPLLKSPVSGDGGHLYTTPIKLHKKMLKLSLKKG